MSDLDDQRFNDTLRRMLATPPKPHEPLGKPKRRAPKPDRDRGSAEKEDDKATIKD